MRHPTIQRLAFGQPSANTASAATGRPIASTRNRAPARRSFSAASWGWPPPNQVPAGAPAFPSARVTLRPFPGREHHRSRTANGSPNAARIRNRFPHSSSRRKIVLADWIHSRV